MSALEALFDAIKKQDVAAVTRALDAQPALATARSASGQTPAIVAIYWRAPQILALLRTRGAELDVFEAAAAGDAERVRTLLAADPSLRDAHAPDGWTPLHAAAAGGADVGVMRRLLAAGARVDHRQSAGYTALHEVAAIGNADVVRLLLEAGAESDARNGEGRTPAELARAAGHAALADVLDGAVARRVS